MNSRIVEKIKKLLNLSKSSNEHEAANAAARAAALMTEHQISVATLEEPDDPDDTIGTHIMDNFGKKVVWKGDLAFGVAASFGCKYYWTGGSPTMVGFKRDVDAVKYIYQYLVREINRLAEESWRDYRFAEFESARAYKTAFRKGASMIVRRRLQDARKESIEKEKQNADILKSQAIVKVERRDEEIQKFYKNISSKFGTFTPSNKIGSLDGLNAGKKAGKNIRLTNNGPGLRSGTKGLSAKPKQLGGK